MLPRIINILVVLGALSAGSGLALAQSEKEFELQASEALIDSGLMKHLVPRFSMKTGIRVTLSPAETSDAPPDVLLSDDAPDGRPALADGEGRTYFIDLVREDASNAAFAERFQDWLLSEIGQRTVAAFKPDGTALFSGAADARIEAQGVLFEGNITRGAELSLTHCGRCHVIGEVNRQNGLGSTPSFGVLRAMPDWDQRFQTFYVLNPHPSFTQVDEVTPDFDPLRPPPIHPVEITLDDLDQILAFVASVQPADLGAPIQHQ